MYEKSLNIDENMKPNPNLHLLVPRKSKEPGANAEESKEPAANAEDLFHVADWPMHYFLAIDRYHVRNMTKVLAPFDCSPLVWRLLSILAGKDGQNVSELAEVSVIERSNLSRILDSMEGQGLITRVDRVRDKRQTQIFITDAGRNLFSQSLDAVLDYYARFLTGISPAEMTVLMSLLKKIKRNVKSFQHESEEDDDL
jgi:DNA-binding MarR family transcriptional regulator